MKAVYIKHGLKGGLKYGECPKPKPKPYEVLVEIHASSINPVEWKLLGGLKLLPGIPGKPTIWGCDLSGVVVEVGSLVKKFKPGDEVYALTVGAYAEYIAIPVNWVSHKPSNMTHEEAAAVPLGALTAWQMLLKIAKMKSGDKVLVIGASGGVGTYAVQIAKALGASVTGVCSTTNIELVKSLGAEKVIDYKKEKFNDILTGYDIVLDCVGNESLRRCKSVLKPDGIYVTALPNLFTNLEMLTTYLKPPGLRKGQKSLTLLTIPGGSDLEQLRKLIEKEGIRSVIDKIYPLQQTEDAHEYSKQGRTKGKLVIKIR